MGLRSEEFCHSEFRQLKFEERILADDRVNLFPGLCQTKNDAAGSGDFAP